MTISETKIDFLGEMVGLDDLIKRIEEMAKTETSFSDPWFIGECVYSCGNIPLTIPFKTFGDFVTAFSNGQHPSSVTDDSGGLRFNFDIDGEPNVSNQLTSAFYIGVISEDIAKEFMRVYKKYEKYLPFSTSSMMSSRCRHPSPCTRRLSAIPSLRMMSSALALPMPGTLVRSS